MLKMKRRRSFHRLFWLFKTNIEKNCKKLQKSIFKLDEKSRK